MSPLLRPLRRAWWTIVWHVCLPMVGGGLQQPLMRLVPGWVSDRTRRRIRNWLHRVELIPSAWAGRACWEIAWREEFEALRVPRAVEKLAALDLRASAYAGGRWRIRPADASPTDGDLREFLMQPICRSPDELLAVAEALQWYAYLRELPPSAAPEEGQGG